MRYPGYSTEHCMKAHLLRQSFRLAVFRQMRTLSRLLHTIPNENWRAHQDIGSMLVTAVFDRIATSTGDTYVSSLMRARQGSTCVDFHCETNTINLVMTHRIS